MIRQTNAVKQSSKLLHRQASALRWDSSDTYASKTTEYSTSRGFVTSSLYKFAKGVMPRVSETERAALECGTVGFDREIFSGKPSFQKLLDTYEKTTLPPNEQAFMDNEVQQLCEMCDDYQIMKDQDLPQEVWDFLKEKGFLGMIVPKEYGGLGFTAHGHSQVVTKISSRSATAAVSASVPNSLGPAELLMRYGTEDQKNYFLPKLASGEHLPCFGLTGPSSGSDAANMRDKGEVCMQDGVLGIKATFNKRYITLAPVASCVGLAVDVSDPHGLLQGNGSEGITVVLLERDHPGLEMGKRHNPVAAFMNGPVTGTDVFIPLEKVIGGQTRVGFGWNMLMDCLAEGRAISLPASAVAMAKGAANAVGGYSRIRKQFNVPIAEFEGIQEHLAQIASTAFITTSGQHLVNAMINKHEQPSVLSAVCKQQITDRGRDSVIRAMDVLGGAAICQGPNNFMANAYVTTPVAITVEGANTLTRSLIIFGQGLTRAHPHLFDLIKTLQDGNDIQGFKKEVTNLVKHGVSNFGNSLSSAVTRNRSRSDLLAYHESQMNRLATNFALMADMSLVLGGRIKFAEMISGRFADAFSALYLGYASMWFYKNNESVENLDKIFDFSMKQLEYECQTALVGVTKNFPVPGIGGLMRGLTFPTGQPYELPSDKDISTAAGLISRDTAVRDLLSDNVFVSDNADDRVAMINATLPKAEKADKILSKIKKEKRQPTAEESKIIDEVEALRDIIIQVDNFDGLGIETTTTDKDYVRPALKKPLSTQKSSSAVA